MYSIISLGEQTMGLPAIVPHSQSHPIVKAGGKGRCRRKKEDCLIHELKYPNSIS
jgi:hypothetical protein